MKYKAHIFDGKQGKVELVVDAESEEDAEDEAYMAGMENGCDCIEEIVVVEIRKPDDLA